MFEVPYFKELFFPELRKKGKRERKRLKGTTIKGKKTREEMRTMLKREEKLKQKKVISKQKTKRNPEAKKRKW